MDNQFRAQFPALRREENGRPFIFMDGPAGVQVPDKVIDAISNYYKQSNANSHGAFITSRETDHMVEEARLAMADFLGAEGPETISLGQNMTTLNFMLSRAIGRGLQPGDEVLITQLDHEGNRGPWLSLRERGIIVREVRLNADGQLDYQDFAAKINERTRLVAMGYSSNILGTVNDFTLVRKLSYEVGAWLLIDAVHAAPHFSIDVQSIGCDFLLCSAYKFYGPHVGILYTRPGLLDRLQPDRLRTTSQYAPYSIETGTLNHAAIAGVGAAVDFLAEIGTGETRRARLVSAMQRVHQHEINLGARLYNGLQAIRGVQVLGQPFGNGLRAPTLAVKIENKRPEEVCKQLAEQHIFAWDGHFYAIRAAEILGVLEEGGVTRLGISAYTTEEEVDTVIEAIRAMATA